MSTPSARFTFTKVIVDDLEKPAAFYKTVLGMREMFRVSDFVTPEMPIEEIMLSASGDMQAEPPLVLFKFIGKPAPKDSDCILGFTVADVDAVVARAVAAGGKVVRAPKDQPEHGVRVAFVTDIDGRLLEVVQMLAPGA